jgi:hypothetical protein
LRIDTYEALCLICREGDEHVQNKIFIQLECDGVIQLCGEAAFHPSFYGILYKKEHAVFG